MPIHPSACGTRRKFGFFSRTGPNFFLDTPRELSQNPPPTYLPPAPPAGHRAGRTDRLPTPSCLSEWTTREGRACGECVIFRPIAWELDRPQAVGALDEGAHFLVQILLRCGACCARGRWQPACSKPPHRRVHPTPEKRDGVVGNAKRMVTVGNK